jgi:exonuclease SbcC
MRLHRLELTAFGPYAAHQSVDFDELSAAGLFLLHGPTGAGKTSVLDGICYALYGQVPGARPVTRLRSDHARPGTATEVVLELTLGERRLEITRRPEQLRAKKRGSGTTTDKAVTLLRERVDGQWRGLSRSHQEIGEEIRQLVGMNCEQFCQVVLLPQGEFATFLRASATERAALLGRLFDTRRFKAVEHWLRDRKAQAAQQLAQGDDELRQLAARMRQAAGPGTHEPGDGDQLLEWAAVLRCDARERHAVAAAAVARAEADHAFATAASAAARDLHALQQRHAQAAARAAVLDAERPARTAARGALEHAHRAATVEPALALRDKAATRLAEAASAADRVLAELAACGEELPDRRTAGAPGAERDGAGRQSARTVSAATGGLSGGVPAARRQPPGPARGTGQHPDADGAGAGDSGTQGRPPTVPKARDEDAAGGARVHRRDFLTDALARRSGRLREELGGLAAAREAETRLGELAGRRAALERDERVDEEAVRDAQTWLDGWPQVRAQAQRGLDDAMEGAARAAELSGALESARRRLDAAAERDRLAGETAHAEDLARDARDRTAARREAWQDLREARIAGIAAELAGGLAAGEPCRVCGAVEHPAPARPSGRQVHRADEDAAYDVFQRESGGYEQARDHVARLRAALDAASAAAGDTALSELAAAHAVLAEQHAAAVRRAAAVPEARGSLARAEEERDRRASRRQDALQRIAARTSRREELDEQHERLTAELARARADHASVEARRRHLAARIALLDRAAQTVRDRTDGAAGLAEAEAALAEAAVRAGFGSPAEAAAALLPAPRLWEAERRAQAWAREEAAVEAELAAPEPAAAATRPPADPEAARAALDDANRRLRDASSSETAAETRCRELDRLSALAAARTRELGPARGEFARIRRLADLAAATTAENRFRMELETYVLAARLEQVAAAAGVRLQRMSAGRYTLVHTDARSGGRGKSGLGLMVVDAWTGTERDTSTLSGGETFFASLALALGLADVVTDESGGTRLDTLFIDEGFGTLDEQTLDEVLDVLDGLRERDRAVGIVSHVADLHHRIPAQLRIVKGRDGSSVRVRTGGRD